MHDDDGWSWKRGSRDGVAADDLYDDEGVLRGAFFSYSSPRFGPSGDLFLVDGDGDTTELIIFDGEPSETNPGSAATQVDTPEKAIRELRAYLKRQAR